MSTVQECAAAAEIYSSLRNASCRSVHPPRRRWTEASAWIPVQDPLLKQNQIFLVWRWGECICLSCILRWAVSKRHSAHLSMLHFPAEKALYFTSTPSFFWRDVEVFASRLLCLGKYAARRLPRLLRRSHVLAITPGESGLSICVFRRTPRPKEARSFPWTLALHVKPGSLPFNYVSWDGVTADVQSSQCFSTLSKGADKTVAFPAWRFPTV